MHGCLSYTGILSDNVRLGRFHFWLNLQIWSWEWLLFCAGGVSNKKEEERKEEGKEEEEGEERRRKERRKVEEKRRTLFSPNCW